MGAWDIGNFANDSAMDWVLGLSKADDLSIVRAALVAVTEEKGHLEEPVCSEALAAAEVVASLHGMPAEKLPDDVQAFADRFDGELPESLLETARQAVAKIGEDSELQELWDESGENEEWQAVLGDLLARLEDK